MKSDVLLSEMKEFAGFIPCEQRYIRRSLCVAFEKEIAFDHLGRSKHEKYSIQSQDMLYMQLEEVRNLVKEPFSFDAISTLMPDLITMTTFDINQGSLYSFNAYRFLYERTLGAKVRKWLPSAFLSVAASPHLKPEKRKVLMQSISEGAATTLHWSEREPVFFPEWIEK